MANTTDWQAGAPSARAHAGEEERVGGATATGRQAGSDGGRSPAEAPVVWVGCKYAPVELLAGFGAQVRTLDADVASFEAADRLGGANLCGYGKALLTQVLDPQVHAVVLTNCCDVTRRVYEIARARGDFDFIWMLDLPHKSRAREARRLRDDLERMALAFARATGHAFDTGRACAAFEAHVPATGPHVTLLGAHAPQALVEAAAAGLPVPVENLTCSGARTLPAPPPQLARAPHGGPCSACIPEGDGDGHAATARDGALGRFLDWYAPALLAQTPCMRMDDVSARQALTGGRGKLGIVYHTMKFCDYYGFEYASMCRDGSASMLKVETDGTSQSAGQLRTRIEAFGEALLARRGKDTRSEAADASEAGANPADAAGESAPARGAAGQPRQADPQASPAKATVSSHPAGHSSAALPTRPGRFVVGVDSGSTTTDAALVDMDGNLVAGVIIRTGAKASASAQNAIDQALAKAGATREDVALYVSTGYGRDVIEGMDAAITEITCHARGAHYLAPDTRTVIDIGGQDSKAIHLDEHGGVLNFVMNDKCAAGTGRFLEMMAHTLEMPLEELSRAGLSSTREVRISNMCSVFAESEVVSLIADDTPTADIVAGLCMSVANKTKSLARRVNAEPAYLMTGGVANNEGVVRALSQVLGAPVRTHEDSQLCGAIGAALLGLERLRG